MSAAMRRGWLITGVAMLLICIATLWEAHYLSLFDRLGPGPGFFPFWLALIGSVLCAAILVQVFRTPIDTSITTPIFPRGEIAREAAAILLCAMLAAAVMEWLGFRIAIMLLSSALLFALGERRWWAIMVFALVAGFGVFHVFNNWLDVLLPVGIFGV